jgi:hypothetical protein
VVVDREVVWTNELVVSKARRVADARPALTIIIIPVWAFPDFTMRQGSARTNRHCDTACRSRSGGLRTLRAEQRLV